MGRNIILFITALFVTLAWVDMARADHKGWPHGKKFAYKCVTEGGCDLDITSLHEQPKLFIGKSNFNGTNKAINIADKGPLIKPTEMIGIWGNLINNNSKYDVSDECQGSVSCKTLTWKEYYDIKILASPSGSDDELIWKNEQFEDEAIDGGMRNDWRHSHPISHLLQTGNLTGLKDGMVSGAEGDWIRILESDKFLYKSTATDYQLFGNSLNWFYPTIIPLIEAHIVLQQNNLYTKEEFELVHSWLEKRVWALEQGPMDGLLSSRWGWKHFFEPGNHETINKKVAYMLWGIADQNEVYFTAGFNGFKDFYSTMRNNGSLKGEHKSGNGQNYGINSGNKVAQGMIAMAILLHNQGYDIQKDFPKIDKLVAYCSKKYKKPSGGGQNNNLRFMSNNPNEYNTTGWMDLYDTVFGTSYAINFPIESKRMIHFGIADASALNLN